MSLIPTDSGCEWKAARGGQTIERGVELTKAFAKEKAETVLTKTEKYSPPKSYSGMDITNLGQLIDAIKYPGHMDDVLVFGKFKGYKVKDVPPYYIKWAQKEIEKENTPPVYVECEHCHSRVNVNDPSEFPKDNFIDITSVEYPGARYGADCLIYKCPKCGKKTESLMRR